MRKILFRAQQRRKGERVRLDGTPVPSNDDPELVPDVALKNEEKE